MVLQGTKIPVEYGGQGGDYLAYALMNEEFARVCPVLAIYANTPNSLWWWSIITNAEIRSSLKNT